MSAELDNTHQSPDWSSLYFTDCDSGESDDIQFFCEGYDTSVDLDIDREVGVRFETLN